MSQVELRERQLVIKGPLGFETVMRVFKMSLTYWQQHSIETVELSEVGQADSAALALFCEWVALAKQKQVDLKFINPPKQLVRLAEVSGVSGLLGLASMTAL